MKVKLNYMNNLIENGNVILTQWINLGNNLVLVISGSNELLTTEIPTTSSYAVSSSYATKVKEVPPHSHSYTTNTTSAYNPTGGFSKTSQSASYISGALSLQGAKDGCFPMYLSSSLTKESPIRDCGDCIYVEKPLYSTNLPSSVSQTTGSKTMTLIINMYIPVIINGVSYKIALVK